MIIGRVFQELQVNVVILTFVELNILQHTTIFKLQKAARFDHHRN